MLHRLHVVMAFAGIACSSEEPPRAWVVAPPPAVAPCVCGSSCSCTPGTCPGRCPVVVPASPRIVYRWVLLGNRWVLVQDSGGVTVAGGCVGGACPLPAVRR